ncbi:MAG: IclR family transcriptional regulator [Chloroflexota bacterium]
MSVQSLTRAFEILSLISQSPEGIGVTPIADKLSLHKSTVSRLLVTLEELNVVQRLPKYGGYCLGTALVTLALRNTPHQQLEAIAKPFLQELTDVTTESATLEAVDGHFVHYLAQVQSNHAIRVDDWLGRRHPLHIVTSGALFMSTWAEQALQLYFTQPLERPTEQTIVHLAQMKQQISKAVGQGFAMSVDAFADGLTGLSAPIYGANSHMIAAINISGPSFRFRIDERVTARLTAVTSTISAQLARLERLQ